MAWNMAQVWGMQAKSKGTSDGGLETWFYGSRSRLGLARDYSIENTRPEEEKNENRGMKKSTQSAVDSNIPSEKMMFFV